MRRILPLAVLSLVLVTSTASAQRPRTSAGGSSASRLVELGVDGSLNFGLGGDNNVTVLDVPVSRVRAGFFVTPQWSVEPSFGLQRRSGGGSLTTYTAGVGALYHFSPVRTSSQIYVRPFVAINGFNLDPDIAGVSSESETSTDLGAGLGVKFPATDRLSWRIEAYLSNNSKQLIDDADNRFGLNFGVSYFTR